MGTQVGESAYMGLNIFPSFNLAFAPKELEKTKISFINWLREELDKAPDEKIEEADIKWAIVEGKFLDFAEHMHWIQPSEKDESRRHVDQHFEPGTYDIIGHVAIANLCGYFSNWPRHKMLSEVFPSAAADPEMRDVTADDYLNEFYPRPMTFERKFGDREEIVIRSTDYGIKVVLQTLPEEKHEARSESRWRYRKDPGYLEPAQRLVVDTFLQKRNEQRQKAVRAQAQAELEKIDQELGHG